MKILFSSHLIWLPIILLVALAMAYAMYFGFKKPSVKGFAFPQWLLVSLRFLGIFMLMLLLLSPYLSYKKEIKFRPKIDVVIDNSLSVALIKEKSWFDNLKKSMEALKGFDIDFHTLDGSLIGDDSLRCDANSSNLTEALNYQINKNTNNQRAVLLVSDGIYNEGANPSYYPFAKNTPIFSLGIGDTSINKDLKVAEVKTNEFVLLGNTYPLQFDILAFDCANEALNIKVYDDGKIVYQSSNSIAGLNYFFTKQIILKAEKPGTHRIGVQVSALNGEKNIENNAFEVFVNVIDNRKKIGIYHQGLHPDIRAIQQALKKQQNYEVLISNNINDLAKVDAIIAMQVPNLGGAENSIIASNKPTLIVGGEMIDWQSWTSVLGPVNAKTINPNLATFSINKSFSAFETVSRDIEMFNQLPPLTVPFATYPDGFNVLAFQKINGIETNYPLIAVGSAKNSSRRLVVIYGEGLWRWSLNEFRVSKSHEAMENLVDHLLQWLLTGRDKPTFSTKPVKNAFDKNEDVVIKADLYNQVFEPVTNAKIEGQIIGDSFSTKFVFNIIGDYYSFNAGNLPQGNYTIKATVDGKNANGAFSVSALSKELKNTSANWALLRNLSGNAKASFYPFNERELLFNEMANKLSKTTIIRSQEELKDLIQLPFVLGLIALFFGLEWILRKYYGKP